MVITRKALSRRTILRGLGVALPLPLLDCMAPALTAFEKTAAAPPRRLGFVYVPNGANQRAWRAGDGPALALSRTLAPLEPVRDYVTVVSGLRSFNGDGDHSPGQRVAHRARGRSARWARRPTASRSARVAPTGERTASSARCRWRRTGNGTAAAAPAPREHAVLADADDAAAGAVPARVVFERLFGTPGTPRRVARWLILDLIAQDTRQLLKTWGWRPRGSIAVRHPSWSAASPRMQEQTGSRCRRIPPGIPDAFDEQVKLLGDPQVLAYQAGLARDHVRDRRGRRSARTHIGVPEAPGVSRDHKPGCSAGRSAPTCRCCPTAEIAATRDGDSWLSSLAIYESG